MLMDRGEDDNQGLTLEMAGSMDGLQNHLAGFDSRQRLADLVLNMFGGRDGAVAYILKGAANNLYEPPEDDVLLVVHVVGALFRETHEMRHRMIQLSIELSNERRRSA